MNILSVAYPFAPVTPDCAGGAEQVLASLDNALVLAGHRSLVLAMQGSAVAGNLTPIPVRPGTIDDQVRRETHAQVRLAIADVVQRNRIDLIHMHGIDAFQYLPVCEIPTLITLHLPLAWYDPQFLANPPAGVHFQCVSESQRASAPPGARITSTIPNGVDLDFYRFSPSGENYALFLGRICPEKGVERALRVATAANIRLRIAGRVYPYPDHLRYFEEQVKPLLRDPHQFLGPVAPKQKRDWLAHSRCLIAPGAAPETSSLVSMESLACGTPVVATPLGALPEIVMHGVTGFLETSDTALVDAVHRTTALSRIRCRAEAERHFDFTLTRDRYFALYAELISGRL